MESTVNLNHKRSELHHANQWACQAQMESRRIFEEFTTKSRLYQENHASDCMEIEELRRICHEETERARQLRTGESALVSNLYSARHGECLD